MSKRDSRTEKTYEEKQASKHITEASMRKFRMMLSNRAIKHGVNIIIANQYYPSSQKCSICGNLKEMKVDKRIYKCEHCGLIIDRDLNAAINLANYIKK